MSIADKVDAREQQPRFHRDVRLVLDAAAFARAQDLNHQLDQALLSSDDEDVTTGGPQQLVDQLEQLHADHPPVLFRFEARTPDEWTDLLSAHENDPKRLWHHVFAASCTVFEDEPADEPLDPDLVIRYAATLTPGQWAVLVEALRALNERLFDLRPTSAAYAALRRLRHSSTSATGG